MPKKGFDYKREFIRYKKDMRNAVLAELDDTLKDFTDKGVEKDFDFLAHINAMIGYKPVLRNLFESYEDLQRIISPKVKMELLMETGLNNKTANNILSNEAYSTLREVLIDERVPLDFRKNITERILTYQNNHIGYRFKYFEKQKSELEKTLIKEEISCPDCVKRLNKIVLPLYDDLILQDEPLNHISDIESNLNERGIPKAYATEIAKYPSLAAVFFKQPIKGNYPLEERLVEFVNFANSIIKKEIDDETMDYTKRQISRLKSSIEKYDFETFAKELNDTVSPLCGYIPRQDHFNSINAIEKRLLDLGLSENLVEKVAEHPQLVNVLIRGTPLDQYVIKSLVYANKKIKDRKKV